MKPIEVAAALVFRDGRLLITRRHPDSHLGGLWEFPGGKKEPDETYEECLVRELREELGIEVAVRGLVEQVDHTYPEKAVSLRFFRCFWMQNEPQAIGCQSFKWISPDELAAHEFPAADARLLHKLENTPLLWERTAA